MRRRCVVRLWLLENCSWKEQTVILCALRGADSAGSPEIKAITRWIRRTVLENAAPNKTFMRDEGFPSLADLAEKSPLVLDMLPVHFLSHLMHAMQVIGERHPDVDIAERASKAYRDLCDYLHLVPESSEAMDNRLADEVDP